MSKSEAIKENAFLAGLKNGRPQCGLWCSLPNPDIIELFSYSKPDWIMLDLEHTSGAIHQLADIERAAASADTPLIVRVPSLNGDDIKRALDCGIQSLFIPQIKSAREVADAISFSKYPPNGIRGVAGTTRASRFGHWGKSKKALENEIAIIVQIETTEAVENVEKILATPGLSGIFIGPADLSAALGHMDNPNHPDVLSTIETVLDAAQKAEMPIGIFATSVEAAQKWVEKGFAFVSIGQDSSMLLSETKARTSEFRKRCCPQ
ncbi:MAG: aldolase/citrate lyase family protein [Pseudomonadota bacterium]